LPERQIATKGKIDAGLSSIKSQILDLLAQRN
jgi:hypothetical protein